MLYLDDIKVEFESQGFKGTHIGISPNKDKSVLFLESLRSTQTVQRYYTHISDDTDKETMKSLKKEAKTEKQEYSQLKKAALVITH